MKLTLSVALAPGAICAVPLPAHLFALPPVLAEQTKNVWERAPLLVTLNVTEPVATDLVESVNENSEGLPAVTVTVAPDAFAGCAIAGTAQASTAAETRPNMTTRSLVIRFDPP